MSLAPNGPPGENPLPTLKKTALEARRKPDLIALCQLVGMSTLAEDGKPATKPGLVSRLQPVLSSRAAEFHGHDLCKGLFDAVKSKTSKKDRKTSADRAAENKAAAAGDKDTALTAYVVADRSHLPLTALNSAARKLKEKVAQDPPGSTAFLDLGGRPQKPRASTPPQSGWPCRRIHAYNLTPLDNNEDSSSLSEYPHNGHTESEDDEAKPTESEGDEAKPKTETTHKHDAIVGVRVHRKNEDGFEYVVVPGVEVTSVIDAHGHIQHKTMLSDVLPRFLEISTPIRSDRNGRLSRMGLTQLAAGAHSDIGSIETLLHAASLKKKPAKLESSRMDELVLDRLEDQSLACDLLFAPSLVDISRASIANAIPLPPMNTSTGTGNRVSASTSQAGVDRTTATPAPKDKHFYHHLFSVIGKQTAPLSFVRSTKAKDGVTNYRILDEFMNIFSHQKTSSGYLIKPVPGQDADPYVNLSYTQAHLFSAAEIAKNALPQNWRNMSAWSTMKNDVGKWIRTTGTEDEESGLEEMFAEMRYGDFCDLAEELKLEATGHHPKVVKKESKAMAAQIHRDNIRVRVGLDRIVKGSKRGRSSVRSESDADGDGSDTDSDEKAARKNISKTQSAWPTLARVGILWQRWQVWRAWGQSGQNLASFSSNSMITQSAPGRQNLPSFLQTPESLNLRQVGNM
ncbi:hypothetical protein C8F01DRAFT_1094034 [Mycena amicta]|nr:hypothetical protein C8F01DRAFT_1094034 [Mycena amicta]